MLGGGALLGDLALALAFGGGGRFALQAAGVLLASFVGVILGPLGVEALLFKPVSAGGLLLLFLRAELLDPGIGIGIEAGGTERAVALAAEVVDQGVGVFLKAALNLLRRHGVVALGDGGQGEKGEGTEGDDGAARLETHWPTLSAGDDEGKRRVA
ncbi:MAG: hypothetical protein QM760_00555 [Nibricoccus sp.]